MHHASWAAVGATKLGDGRYARSPRMRQNVPCRRWRQYYRIRMSSAAHVESQPIHFSDFPPITLRQIIQMFRER